MMRHFTASAYVVQDNRVLLLKHKKLKKWLPPGGHVDPNETPQEAAVREVKEECGIDIEIESDDFIHIDEENAISLKRPLLTLLEEIPAHGSEPKHQHIDQVFIAKTVGPTDLLGPEECRWFTEEELNQLPEEELYTETRNVIHKILNLALL